MVPWSVTIVPARALESVSVESIPNDKTAMRRYKFEISSPRVIPVKTAAKVHNYRLSIQRTLTIP
jgi:hypothetical protein